jgi:hypothetical protein
MYVNKSIVEIYIPLLLVVYDIFKNRVLVGAFKFEHLTIDS